MTPIRILIVDDSVVIRKVLTDALSESLYQITDEFRTVHFPGTTSYLKPAPAPEGAAKP